jgi:hypothetical protein
MLFSVFFSKRELGFKLRRDVWRFAFCFLMVVVNNKVSTEYEWNTRAPPVLLHVCRDVLRPARKQAAYKFATNVI